MLVDDITHKVEGKSGTVLRVLPQFVYCVAKEMRVFGLDVSLKSGMERCSDKSFSILGRFFRFTMIKARHQEVADSILHLMHQDGPPSLMAATRAAGELRGASGFDPPSWQDLANEARPPFHDLDDQEPGVVRHGWQHEAASPQHHEVYR